MAVLGQPRIHASDRTCSVVSIDSRVPGNTRLTRAAEVRLRISVLEPPAGVQFRLQEGRADLIAPTRMTAEGLQFEFNLRLGPPRRGRPNFLGPAAQGPPDGRFVYINSGRRAGQQGTVWDRRAKIPLGGITSALLDMVLKHPDHVLEARIAGTGRDGGPACATVPLLEGWRLASGAAV